MTIPVGKYMHAEPVGCDPEVYTIHVRDGTAIGHAEWYPPWRGYVFSPEFGSVFSHDCCAEMARFLDSCNRAKKVLEQRYWGECNSCGSRPFQWGLVRPDHKAGDQCPCCYLDDYDCDGTLVLLESERKERGE